ncbi:hypothetical protein BJV74DRAFT_860067 [Russula compacta]|nr:hypothetical protein BJV74DRAFT_860067 [Russula compacta]
MEKGEVDQSRTITMRTAFDRLIVRRNRVTRRAHTAGPRRSTVGNSPTSPTLPEIGYHTMLVRRLPGSRGR